MSILDPLPKYLTTSSGIALNVFSAAFSGVILQILATPFLRNTWVVISSEPAGYLTAIMEVLALGVLIGTGRVLYQSQFNRTLSYLNYILSIISEIFLLSLIYVFFTMEGYDYGMLELENRPDFAGVFIGIFVFCTLWLASTYVIIGQYLAIKDKNNTIRLMNYSGVVTDVDIKPEEEQKITLYDETGALKLSVSMENIYFIESDDNYVKVWYADARSDVKQYMLRCRLRTIEDSFSGSDLVRCHRKYIVNVKKIEVLRHDRDGYFIDLGLSSIEEIPVSKTYEQKILQNFNSR